MRKLLVFLSIVIIALCFALIFVISGTPFVIIKDAGTFSINDYQEELQFYNDVIKYYEDDTPKYLPIFSGTKELCSSAQRFWVFLYGNDADNLICHYSVSYDESSHTYLIIGKLKNGLLKCKNAYLIVNEADGKILTCWADRD